jgi:uncharacterized protein (TIGR00369 family)
MNSALSVLQSAPQNAAQKLALTLEQWEADEASVRARMGPVGVARPDQVFGKTGQEFFDAIFSGELPAFGIGETLDFLPIEIKDGRAVYQGRPSARHYNPMGTVHGGWFSAMLDSAVGCAVHCTLAAGKAFTTAELKVNIVRPLTDKITLVRAEGQVIHLGKRMATADGRLVGADGKLYAHASTTCFIFDAQA